VAVSTITQVADEYLVQALGSFDRSGTLYIAWTAAQGSLQTVYWKQHTQADGLEVQAAIGIGMTNISTLYRTSNDSVVLAYDTDAGPGSNSSIFVGAFKSLTGVQVAAPVLVASGFRPRLMYRGGVVGDRMILVYANRATNTMYLRESTNGGVSWGAERPVISNLIEGISSIHAVPYDDEHISVLALGIDSRPLQEIVSFSHTRPWTSLLKHPTVADEWFVSECSQNAALGLSDHLRGSLVLQSGGSTLFWADGTSLGSSDSIGSVALLSTSGNAISVLNSTSPTPSTAGQDIVALSTTPASTHVTNVLSSGPILASLAASASFVYGAAYSDTPGSDGSLVVYNISTQAFAPIVSVTNGHAAGVGIPPTGAAVICFGTTESGVEKLRIYTENALSPTLQNTHLMPARINSINVVMTSASAGTLYVSMVDRLNVYVVNGLTSPLRLTLSIPVLTRGQFFQSVLSPSGNIVAAVGKAGVGIFDKYGRTVAQAVLSGVGAQPWGPGLGTVSLGQAARPTPASFYAPALTWFKATTAGTSAVNEPFWAPAGNSVPDGSAVWQEQGDIQSVVTGVAVDQTRNRVYAVGVVGGNPGVLGRFYALSATGLL
jgi:hypothetical protein